MDAIPSPLKLSRKSLDNYSDASGTEKGSIQTTHSLSPVTSQESAANSATSKTKLSQSPQVAYIPNFDRTSLKALLEEIRVVDVIETATLLNSVLRPVSSDELMRVKSHLIVNNCFPCALDCGSSLDVAQNSKGSGALTISEALEKIYTNIVDSAILCGFLKEEDCLLAPLVVRDGEKYDSNQSSRSQPDGYMYLKSTSSGFNTAGVLDYADVVLFMGLRQHDSLIDRMKNTSKLLWSLRHKISGDPRCRHVFGLTIEGTQMRFWHCDRSAVAVSEVFDFLKEPDFLIHIFLALASSTEIDLGFDPTIQCVRSEPFDPNNETASSAADTNYSLYMQQKTYHITVEGHNGVKRTFETVQLLSNLSASIICSHGTRVWEVFDVQDPLKQRRVLKESWIESGEPLEGDFLTEMRNELQDKPGQLDHLPEVLIHGVVRLPDGNPDDVFDYIRRKVDWGRRQRLPLIEDYDGFSFYSPIHNVVETGDMVASEAYCLDEQTLLNMKSMAKKETRRCHSRLVYTDPPGITFRDLHTHDEMFTALTGALKALNALYSVGYVHRKLTNSNIILSKDSSKGVLIDFEFTQRFSELPLPNTTNPDRQTDLRQFMSVEVDLRDNFFLFVPQEPIKFPLIQPSTPPEKPERIPPPVPEWFHNPIHDMESIWWIAIWSTLFFTRTGLLDVKTWGAYHRLFPPSPQHSKLTRHHVMKRSTVFHEEYQQPFFTTYLASLRDLLQYAHTTLQVDLNPVKNRPLYQETFEKFLGTMKEMIVALGPLGKYELKPLRGLQDSDEEETDGSEEEESDEESDEQSSDSSESHGWFLGEVRLTWP
ncbi:hypothetical protein CPB86DRAFT_745741 [Serendipita vermifera]|nr:hypothetical protein CPB86DRAFT_745741 [Serendipita vermifera]